MTHADCLVQCLAYINSKPSINESCLMRRMMKAEKDKEEKEEEENKGKRKGKKKGQRKEEHFLSLALFC